MKINFEEDCEEFVDNFVPKGAGDSQRHDMKLAFTIGAACAMSRQMQIAALDVVFSEKAAALTSFEKEIFDAVSKYKATGSKS